MLNIVSILIGLVSLPFAVLAILPVVGLLNWLIIPVVLIGAGIGALSDRTSGRNLNLIVLIVAFLRLTMTGGLF